MGTTQEPPVAEVRVHNGAPTLFVDGQPNAGMTFMMSHAERGGKYVADFARAGVGIVSFCTGLSWQVDGRHDFDKLDREMRTIVDANRRPPGAAWITDEAVEDTRRVWSPYYGRELTEGEAVEILMNVKNLADVLVQARRRR